MNANHSLPVYDLHKTPTKEMLYETRRRFPYQLADITPEFIHPEMCGAEYTTVICEAGLHLRFL